MSESRIKAKLQEIFQAMEQIAPCPPIPLGDGVAPTGKVWVCGACGKRSRGRFNLEASNGWDESCMLNAVLIEETEP